MSAAPVRAVEPAIRQRSADEQSLVHPRERVYFGIAVAFSVAAYLLMIVSVVGIFYIVGGALFFLFVQGLLVGDLRGNGVRVSDRQFPRLNRLVARLSDEMGLKEPPAVYILQAGGLLNAFATRFISRDFVVLYSDILELAYDEGEDAVAFVVAHELAHIKRRHVGLRWLIYPALFVPFLGSAYSRACEYTCDQYGAHFVPAGAVGGLLVLAAGKRLYREVDPRELAAQSETEEGFWVWLAEVLSTHPHLPKRLRALGSVPATPLLKQMA